MLNRVTNQTMAQAAHRNLQASQARLAALQEKGATLQNITRPSDDPAALADALAMRARLGAADQYSNNISDGTGWLNTADSALGQATNILNRIRDLTLQASNSSLNQPARDTIAAELEGLNKDLLASANTKYLGRNVFAGSSDAPSAFTSGQPPIFTGTAGDSVERRVDEGKTVRVDADGGTTFGSGAGSVFALVSDVVATIRSGADPSGRLDAIDGQIKTVIGARAEVGTRQSLLEHARDAIEAQKVTLESRRSAIEDADIGQVVLDLKLQETNYQVALAVTAKVLQPSLMDFLR
jgi:flagellar hook-associated protein 3 FlgL